MWQTHMRTLTASEEETELFMEIAQIIDDALEEHYSELGLPVPNWKRQKDPQWWIDYLRELEIEQ